MPQLVDNLADLTALRDRNALDVALVSAINDLLQPRSTAICRVVGDAGNERWRICAQLNAGQAAPTSDSAWSRLDLLPPLSSHPLRQQALATRQLMQTSDCPNITAFPLSSNPATVGVLEISTHEPLSEDAQRLVSGVLRLYLNFQSLLDYGERDALTELLNRKTFDGAFMKATLEQELTVANGQDGRRNTAAAGSYWLAMIDIDHFKRVNDNYGHLIGDEVLLLLARLMRAHFRFHDQLYRFGGEEFVVLMRCNGEAEAAGVLERLRATTERHLFPQVGTITISIGFTEIKTGDTPSGAFERADKAVYHAKAHGRNQVCSHAALIASGELVDAAANMGEVELF
ncbi:MAG: GGDEF domain-containing protein [Rhodoferax sp.]|nr:GGDEF domain-containing protein [Rhodoferax sp.]